jgi:hypothetical protein
VVGRRSGSGIHDDGDDVGQRVVVGGQQQLGKKEKTTRLVVVDYSFTRSFGLDRCTFRNLFIFIQTRLQE